MNEAFTLPNGAVTEDSGLAAEEWASAFYKLKDALGRLRPIPEQLIRNQPVKDLDETLLECDAALDLGE